MGWTHNWQRPTELPKDEFAKAVADCRAVIPTCGVALGGADGTGEPVFDEDGIVFNGAGDSGCEAFLVCQTQFDRRGRDVFWSFCNTEHTPYDLCVQAALIILKHHLGDVFVVTSDAKDEDWTTARQLCQVSLGYGEEFQLSRPD